MNLQIFNYEKYAEISKNNYVRKKILKPIRGEIYDRNYEPIAINKPAYNLYIKPGMIKDKKKVLDFMAMIFPGERKIASQIIYNNRFYQYREILLFQDLEWEQILKISESNNYFPELVVKAENKRKYIYKNHFTGYVSNINDLEYKKLKKNDYFLNDIIGKNGLEKQYESILRGKTGKRIIQVNSKGKNLKLFKKNHIIKAQNGKNLILTVNNKLQQYAAKIFPGDKNGALLLINANNGEILCYFSNPRYDPNIFSRDITTKEWQNLINDQTKPMLDRCINGTYPPGSVYKPVVACLGLEDDLINLQTKLTACDGGMQIGNRYFKCWLDSGHGRLNVIDALKYSCDVFFYDLSLKFSLKSMRNFTRDNCLLEKTGIDLPAERQGFFPTTTWYRSNYGRYSSIKGHKVNLSIGQGEILVTPLQICSYYAALANDGVWIQPHLLKKITGKSDSSFIPQTRKLPVSDKNLDIIKKSLYKTVNESYGTGTIASSKFLTIYGKTGSAENYMSDTTHAWFSGFASIDSQNIAFTVFIEQGGHGGSNAGPLAKEILEYYHTILNKDRND